MRILAVSDSHGNSRVLRKIIETHGDINQIFFLGDVTRDIEHIKEEFPNKNFNIVSGNCDFNSFYPASDIALIGETKVFFTHGHTLSVKYTLERIISRAKQSNCKLALYGHTHIPKSLYEDGIYLVNPGSCSNPREGSATYAVIDITRGGIMPSIMEV